MPAMGLIISAFRKADLDHPIIVGGAPVTAEFAETIEADGYAEDASGAVDLVKEICARTKAVTCRETRLSA
jgi:5-methyltetrahydrofolate--homocysteine methyltransferase